MKLGDNIRVKFNANDETRFHNKTKYYASDGQFVYDQIYVDLFGSIRVSVNNEIKFEVIRYVTRK
jgi:hypothetical protein